MHSGRKRANVPYVALLGERPGAELIPGHSSNLRIDNNFKRSAVNFNEGISPADNLRLTRSA